MSVHAMARYEISVKGRLDPNILNDLGRFESDERPAITVLRGPLAGQAGLRQLLSQLQARGLELIEVRQLDSDEPGEG
jgi:hypothetical protein